VTKVACIVCNLLFELSLGKVERNVVVMHRLWRFEYEWFSNHCMFYEKYSNEVWYRLVEIYRAILADPYVCIEFALNILWS